MFRRGGIIGSYRAPLHWVKVRAETRRGGLTRLHIGNVEQLDEPLYASTTSSLHLLVTLETPTTDEPLYRTFWDRLRAALAPATGRLPRDNGHLAMLDNSYSYLRQFTRDVPQAISFAGGTGTEGLMEAVAIPKKLNADGARKVPDHAPTDGRRRRPDARRLAPLPGRSPVPTPCGSAQ
ncbi:hypothetical protein OG978_44190 (plasmid) [Streptomyces sp. NBC_01591]|nr:hypothetical protein [Streptomyces sp. NBC_01591]WSD74131.1 hypothetical protein OG978_44190 [Streptomyces sp. NBC_01591]